MRKLLIITTSQPHHPISSSSSSLPLALSNRVSHSADVFIAHPSPLGKAVTMVKFYESSYSYSYSFPAVALAYFLRYPNPYSTHVLSTDTISRVIDPVTGRLTTTRIHQKRTRLPPAVMKLLPKSVLGNVSGGRSESYILETCEVDVKEGWMRTESKNLDWTSILSVIESQEYRSVPASSAVAKSRGEESTDVTTTVTFRSRLGERLRARANKVKDENEVPENNGFFANLGKSGIQRSIEAIASRKTENQLGKAKEGMMVVLERLRSGGLGGVLDGMRKDRELVFATAVNE
ncbi:hypothetical protein BP6252_13440 [Coleophoma cylindrospora]|uniref:PRELI/MSF1 domain-containing protein n=1 Tax=Coleophoma cylindrospora TaxID=1849047 RepID=A0A3D8Q895_9HELO|nr:hypothetical protein BP6252_13440 [Coleophoma cylindrospora]